MYSIFNEEFLLKAQSVVPYLSWISFCGGDIEGIPTRDEKEIENRLKNDDRDFRVQKRDEERRHSRHKH